MGESYVIYFLMIILPLCGIWFLRTFLHERQHMLAYENLDIRARYDFSWKWFFGGGYVEPVDGEEELEKATPENLRSLYLGGIASNIRFDLVYLPALIYSALIFWSNYKAIFFVLHLIYYIVIGSGGYYLDLKSQNGDFKKLERRLKEKEYWNGRREQYKALFKTILKPS